MQRCLWIIGLLFLFCRSFDARGQDPFEINDTIDQHIFSYGDLSWLQEPDSALSIDEILLPVFQTMFKANEFYSPYNLDRESAYWIRLRLKYNPESSKRWLLEFFDQTTDSIEVYFPDNKSYTKKVIGESLPFAARTFLHKNFAVEIANDSDDVKEYYFRVKSKNRVNVIIVLRSVNRFIYYALNEYFLYGLFYGIILVVAIYNLMMYFLIRERQYITYIMYVLSVGIFTMCSDGIAFQYLWPDHPEWNAKASGIALFSLVLCALFFLKQFLHTRSRFPALNKIINGVIVARVLIFIIALFFYPLLFEFRWIEVIPLTIAFYTGINSYLKGYKPARFFVVAYGLLFIGFWVKVFINLDIPLIPGSVVTHYSISISFWFEMWLLSFALADKVRIIKDSKDRALRRIIRQHESNQLLKDKVNRELENEVAKRTCEINDQKLIIESQNADLSTANEKLKEQAAEISRMNALLDLDNYKLKNSIKEEMLARAGRKNMEYKEFKKIFPDELTCWRYLEQQKWGNSYSCKKCLHDKHLPGRGKFDRRCTKCGYNESPTAYTIFHRIRFPIDKAFYIVHLAITERDDLTIDQLSALLELRRNTCWSFKDKVNRQMKKTDRSREQLANWERLIFTAS